MSSSGDLADSFRANRASTREAPRPQWFLLVGAWLGWGFDIFDGFLLTYVLPLCVPALLHLPPSSVEATRAVYRWGGVMTSTMLLGWAAGGIGFGMLADRYGRVRVLGWTILTYALATGACALAPDLRWLLLFRVVASLGIGGEWAAGAVLVSETVPERWRLRAGPLLFTAAPAGLLGARILHHVVAEVWLPEHPAIAWRVVLACGVIPAVLALALRMRGREPDVWMPSRAASARPSLVRLFDREWVRHTWSGTYLATMVAITWWGCNAFLPLLWGGLGEAEAAGRGLDPRAAAALCDTYRTVGATLFNVGGVLGALACAPLAERVGRRAMLATYLLASAAALAVTYGMAWPAPVRLALTFAVGITTFGTPASFTFYLPELFPTYLRGTGSGFCFNTGRIIAAAAPLAIAASVASQGGGIVPAFRALFYLAAVPLIACALLPTAVETAPARCTLFRIRKNDVPSSQFSRLGGPTRTNDSRHTR